MLELGLLRYPYFTAYMTLAALIVVSGMGVATFQQMRLYQRLAQCQAVSDEQCEVVVIPIRGE